MFAIMVAHSPPKSPPASKQQVAFAAAEAPPKMERLVASKPPSFSVIKFAAGAPARAPGAELEFHDS